MRRHAATLLLIALTQALPATAGVVLEDRLGIAVGDTVRLKPAGDAGPGRAMVVSGVFTPPPDPAGLNRGSREARLPITDLESLTGRDDRVSRFVLGVPDGVSVDSLLASLNTTQLGFRAYRADDVARESSQTFEVVSNFHHAISVLSILAGTAFLAAIVMLQVQELRKSLGVLRVIGISRARIFAIVVGETVVLANLGAALGVGVAAIVSRIVNAYYRDYFDTSLVFSSIAGWHVGLAFAVASSVGLLVGSLATAYLFRLRINEVLGR